ncbi:uncharacterized protein LOC133502287 [Syngnathoides biaculeatus]|uniref:uncharacterized protein LOC133502287 n=1 Tax=Syngnathoides biaculeatus TaxID=300417 RepID=UPI002ADE0551|nr:uncharacterized protein LOC133502287 [Syngnathoides biaculeatus]
MISNSRAHAAEAASGKRYYIRPSAGSMKQGVLGRFLVALPLMRDRGDFEYVFDMRSKRFVCMDSQGERHKSRHKNSAGCLFSRIGFISANQRGTFSSPRGSRLLLPHLESWELSSILLKRFLTPLARRQRRSEEVNPSDPLRSESLPLHSVKDQKDLEHGQLETDQAGAVSKETISSCDDPLKVLHANGPVSPVKTIIADLAEQD